MISNISKITDELIDQKVLPVLEEAFANCYSVTRVWSAWSVGTMTRDDFACYDRDDHSFGENYFLLREEIKKNPDENYCEWLIDLYNRNKVELLRNDDIENDFTENSFNMVEFDYDVHFEDVASAIHNLKIYSLNQTRSHKSENAKPRRSITASP